MKITFAPRHPSEVSKVLRSKFLLAIVVSVTLIGWSNEAFAQSFDFKLPQQALPGQPSAHVDRLPDDYFDRRTEDAEEPVSPTQESRHRTTNVIILTGFGFFLVLGLGISGYCYWMSKNRPKRMRAITPVTNSALRSAPTNQASPADPTDLNFSSQEIHKPTP